jgi:hypothetical protein
MHHHNVWHASDARHGRNIANKIEFEIFVERGRDRVCGIDQEQCVTIGRGTHDRLRGDIADGTRSVLDNEWLTKALR